MKKTSIIKLAGREELAKRLIQIYKEQSAQKVTILTGPPGCGKSFVLNKVIDGCQTKYLSLAPICPYLNYGDSFIQASDRHFSARISDVSVSIGTPIYSAGISIGFENKETQYHRLKRMLHRIVHSNILICLDDLSSADSSVKSMAKMILSHLDELERDLSAKIFFLITDVDYTSCADFALEKTSSAEHIIMSPYTEEDIVEYLKSKHAGWLLTEEMRKKVKKLHKISNGNLSLVDFLYVDIAIQNNDYFEALEEAVCRRLSQLKESGQNHHISETEMEDIILAAALSLQRFSTNEISFITDRANNIVTDSLDVAKEETFLDKDSDCFYDFRCSEVKDILWNQSVDKRKERLLRYYQYYTENEQDEYYFRALYLIKYANEIKEQAFALLGLATAFAYRLSDHALLKKIADQITQYGTRSQQDEYNKIMRFYQLLSGPHNDADDTTLDVLYKELKLSNYELPLQGELARSYFHFLYCNRSPFDPVLTGLFDRCLQFASNEISLSPFVNSIDLKPSDETIIRLSIIYDIAPYLLDVRNDVDRFKELYEISETMAHNCKTKRGKGLAQYIENVFNRKAFLFVNQTQCEIYYEKAKNYFSKHQIWEEYCITLVCQAGTNIVIQKYEEAQTCCKLALKTAEEHEIELPQEAKLHNNELIASFLKAEQEAGCEAESVKAAMDIIPKLEERLCNKPCATEFVILTNLCSLCLYCGNDSDYLKYKAQLEELMLCPDVSDLQDEDIDDFYRYYFAWFEAFRKIRGGNWEEAKAISDSIVGFVPALFQKQEIFWKKKEQALADLIETKTVLNAYDFCNNLVRTSRRETALSRFFFRGLMLSDLQYTSYD